MHEILLRAADWWLGTAVGGGLVLLIGCGLMRLTRHPAARQRIGECAVLCALVVASLRLLPAWLPVAWTAKSVTPPSPGFAGEGLGVRAAAPEPSPPTPLPQSRERGEEVASEPAAKTAALPSSTWHDAAAGLMAGYLLIASGLAARWLLGQWALNRLLRQARPAAPRVRRLFKAMAAEALLSLPRLRRRTHLRVARRLRAPVCFGLRRAAVLLPEPMDDAADAQLRWVFAHELTHLRRHDPWSSWGLGLAQAIYFFLPWFWWVKRSVRLCQEYVADAAAAKSGAAPDEYAQFLVNLARGAAPLGATGLGSSSDLLRRVQMLLQSSTRVQGSWPRGRSMLAAGCLLTVAVLAGSVGLRAEPPKEPEDEPEFKTTIIKHAAGAYPYIHWFAEKEQDGPPPEQKPEKAIIHMTITIDTGNGPVKVPLDTDVADLRKEVEKAIKKAQEQIAAKKQQSEATEKALNLLKRELTEEQIKLLQRQIEAMRSQKGNVDAQRATAERAHREAGEKTEASILEQKIADLQLRKISAMASGAGVNHPLIKEMDSQIAEIQRALGLPGATALPFNLRLGVRIQKPSADLADQLDLPKDQGLVVTEVLTDSPAAKAGLKVNDILLQFAGKSVPSNADLFAKSLREMKAKDEIPVVFLRKGRKEKVTIKLPEAKAEGTLIFGGEGGNAPLPNPASKLRDKLNQLITVDKALEDASLQDVLNFLSTKYDVTFVVDTAAFERNGIKAVKEAQVSLPKMADTTLGTVLRFLLAQVKGTYLIRRDHVEITSTEAAVQQKREQLQPPVPVRKVAPPQPGADEKSDFVPKKQRKQQQQTRSVSVQVNNGELTAHQSEADVEYFVTGKVKDGKVDVELIQICLDRFTATYKRIEDVPEKDRDAVKKLIADSIMPLNRIHSPPDEK